MNSKVRVRFAPSPTGYLHVGGARSALFNFLFARHHGGSFILRIEDTDRNRYVESAEREIYESLRWLGLDWDEGPENGGQYGPYVQSQRTALYQKHAQELLDSGKAYRCFCSAERLAQVRTEQEKSKSPLGYDRHCRDLSPEQIATNLAQKLPYVVRFKIPAGGTVAFEDEIRGRIEYRSDVLDDLVLLKSDGFPTYHLANVVDDHAMEITHVLRGDEWIASTPRHVLIYAAFGWTPPHFAHLPVILSPDGGKLSKRKGAASVMDYKQAGFLPEALFNFLALLGWAPGDEREKMSMRELAEAFSLDRVSPKAAVFDEKKLEWMNGAYLAERTAAELVPEVVPAWKAKKWVGESVAEQEPYHLLVIDLLKGRSKRVTDLIESAAYFFTDPDTYEEKAQRKYFKPEIIPHLQKLSTRLASLSSFDQATLENLFREFAEENTLSAGQLIHPVRLAVSGVSFGPGLFELMSALGKDSVVRRIATAAARIGLSSNGASLQ